MMDELWAKLVGIYGGNFTRNYGEEVDLTGAWKATLNGKTWRQIKMGLVNITDTGNAFPPNASEFAKMCIDNRIIKAVHPSHRPFIPRALIQNGTKEESDAIAKNSLAEMRKILGLPPKNEN